jgi:hypothetical protein
LLAILAVASLLESLGCNSQRTDMDLHDGDNSSRPWTIVRMPALWKLFDEIDIGDSECAFSSGLLVAIFLSVFCGGEVGD